MTICRLVFALWLAFCFVATLAASSVSAGQSDDAINFAVPEAVLDLGPALAERKVNDASAPEGVWFTVPIRNSTALPVVRVLAAVDLPGAGLVVAPLSKRPTLVEAVGSDSSLVIERANGFGNNVFRVVVPAAGVSTLALHFEGVRDRPAIFAWMELALVQQNRQAATLSGAVLGLLAAAAAFALGAAVLSGTLLSCWAAIFLAAVLLAEATAGASFDDLLLVRLIGPHALLALVLAVALASAIRLVDRIAPFEIIHKTLAVWRDTIALSVLGLGLVAFAGLPLAGLIVRGLAVGGAVAAAAYLAYCGRKGNAGARRLAPAATIFALVAVAAGCNALGFLGLNSAASGAIGGFAASGALLVAIATAIPLEPHMARARETDASISHTIIPQPSVDAAREHMRDLTAVSAAHQGIFDLDLRCGVLSLSADAAQLFGLPPAAVELGPSTWRERIHPDDREVFQEAIATYRRSPGIAFRLEFRARAGGGKPAWFELRATIAPGAHAERCLGLIANVTARKSSEGQPPVTPAASDRLTGLGTRAALLARLEDSKGELEQVALAVFDLDRFKAVNASLGRDHGDELLVALARRLVDARSDAKPGTAFFRVGGDMFAVVAQGVSQLRNFGQGLVDLLSPPFTIAEREIYLPTSVGVAAGEHADEAQDLLAQAELAMVEAKRQGGGRVCVYSHGLADTQPSDPVALETDLRRALERDEIEVHYQPIVRLKDGMIAGFEALLRWRDPERGMIEPQAFIPYAERSGLIVPLGRCALKKAAEDLARWQRFFPSKPPLYVSVNVTWRQIVDSDFVKELGALLKTSGLAKGSLRLEVTESAVMAGAEEAAAALKRVKNLGAGLAIDDFGTGHSSLSHLTRFPFDTIKIDKSFLAATRENTGLKILASIVSLAKELKLSVVAEGVETQEEAARLKDIGCEFGQGFLLGMAVPAAEINGLIVNAQAR